MEPKAITVSFSFFQDKYEINDEGRLKSRPSRRCEIDLEQCYCFMNSSMAAMRFSTSLNWVSPMVATR